MSELDLERKLIREQARIENADIYSLPYEQNIKIQEKHNELYNKWKLLSGIRKAKEKVNEELDSKNIKK